MIRITPSPLPHVAWLPALLGTTVLVLVIGHLLVWRPLRTRLDETKSATASLQSEARSLALPDDAEPLAQRLGREVRVHQRLTVEWEQLQSRIHPMRAGPGFNELLTTSIEGRIDFKVALFEARQRLGRKAMTHQVALPPDLGIPDTIGADEDTELRLGHLAATVLLLERCIEHGIDRIETVAQRPPRMLALEEDVERHLVFYPVIIRLSAPYDHVVALLKALRTDDVFIALRRFMVMNEQPDEAGALTVQLQWSVVSWSGSPARDRALDQDPGLDDPDYWMFY